MNGQELVSAWHDLSLMFSLCFSAPGVHVAECGELNCRNLL
jgi:hypothetical protein